MMILDRGLLFWATLYIARLPRQKTAFDEAMMRRWQGTSLHTGLQWHHSVNISHLGHVGGTLCMFVTNACKYTPVRITLA